ncbi:MAG: methionyl-tRNA formyltransferase [Candidatus Magasanikbacteria bacterium]|jgi:methionyl-tRNA formyltransferase|nr:methionyl-tRNA formyltransferase [Candidatus Magasanikbacteria bacterium]MBT4314913.1 methionyl-tRNA formyltransferase [Candidatus Magasanikbacteria bacterium]MBT4546869.1 methionyl-tRNA formyltransferase [Candidatus Magasanikbacteria bacterium]MBT6819217.1 methionyl-tRNA formyltransferase [Candidatus Magasanikbacteria bacterium]
MKSIKTVFFGTHDFAVTILQGLIDSPLFDIELVITQPDKPVGRKKELTPPPVKLLAQKHNIKTDQPSSLKDYNLKPNTYNLGITAQYGLLIPEKILNAPIHGTLNTHTSLLPKYRGSSPIQSALIDGETETGVTIMKMDKGLDTGPIILQKSIKIEPNDTYIDLDKKLAKIGISALLEAVPAYVSGELQPSHQDDSQATTCKQFTREDGKVHWNKTAKEIYNLYRGLTPWPGVWSIWKDKRLKLLKIKPVDLELEPGLVKTENGKLYIGTTDKSIEALELQLEGKQKMDIKQFINGYKNIDKQILK